MPNQVHSATDLYTTDIGALEISIGKNTIFTKKAPVLTSSKFTLPESCKSCIDFTQSTTLQIGSRQISSSQIDSFQICSPQISAAQIGSSHIQFKPDVGSSEFNISQNHTLEEIVQLGFTESVQTVIDQFNAVKNSFSSVVALQQLISSHNRHDSSCLLTDIYSTAQTLWSTTTPLNLNFDIFNLPTEQLAEATITEYNSDGTPKAATITIDDDGNGKGWFIDSTPWDSSEFATQLADTAYKATPDDWLTRGDSTVTNGRAMLLS